MAKKKNKTIQNIKSAFRLPSRNRDADIGLHRSINSNDWAIMNPIEKWAKRNPDKASYDSKGNVIPYQADRFSTKRAANNKIIRGRKLKRLGAMAGKGLGVAGLGAGALIGGNYLYKRFLKENGDVKGNPSERRKKRIRNAAKVLAGAGLGALALGAAGRKIGRADRFLPKVKRDYLGDAVAMRESVIDKLAPSVQNRYKERWGDGALNTDLDYAKNVLRKSSASSNKPLLDIARREGMPNVFNDVAKEFRNQRIATRESNRNTIGRLGRNIGASYGTLLGGGLTAGGLYYDDRRKRNR